MAATAKVNATESTALDILAALGGGVGGTSLADLLSPGTSIASTALEKSHRISSGPCTLLQIVATNTDVTDAWLLLFDSASGSVPVDTTVARESYPVPAGGTSPPGVMPLQGSSFTLGCWAALSSTVGTLTLITGSTALFKAEIRT